MFKATVTRSTSRRGIRGITARFTGRASGERAFVHAQVLPDRMTGTYTLALRYGGNAVPTGREHRCGFRSAAAAEAAAETTINHLIAAASRRGHNHGH